MASYPLGLKTLNFLCPCIKLPNNNNRMMYKVFILAATFIVYTCYHLSRRPFSIVRNVWNRNCSNLVPPDDMEMNNLTKETWCQWDPFDGQNANSLFGLLDACFLFSYAIFMFPAGWIAERTHIRFFLSLGMIFSGFTAYLFGISFYYDIHSIYYFGVIQILSGVVQTTGWPAVLTCVGNWFGPESSRGLIFGIWNSHANVGNILGSAIAGAYVEYNWGLSFIIPGLMIAVMGFCVFLFLLPYPEEVGLASIANAKSKKEENEDSDLIEDSNMHAISFMGALKIPGVIEFSVCLFFSKLVNYTFLYWLPRYIEVSTLSSSKDSAYLSTPFDVGGIVGAILAGYVADASGSSALTCVVMLIFTIPSLFLYQFYGSASDSMNIIILLIVGLFVNGPYALITTAISAELGSNLDNNKALATVTAIIDGTGSIGAAVGPYLAGLVSGYSWDLVFYMISAANLLALMSLIRISRNEWKRIKYQDIGGESKRN